MHVVFDLDGVLLDSESDLDWLDRALSATLETYGIAVTPEHRAALYPANIRAFERAAEQFDVPVADLWQTRNEHYLREKIGAIESGEIGPFPDIEVVSEIATTHPVSIISNSPRRVVEVFVETCGLTADIEHAIGRGTDLSAIDSLKPDPHFFEVLHARAGADEYVYVGDTPGDEQFAERTGMAYIHLDRQDGPIDSLHAVAGAIEEMD